MAATVAALAAAPQASAAPAGPVGTQPTSSRAASQRIQPPVGATSVIIAGNITNPVSNRCIGISTILAGIWNCTGNSDQWWHLATNEAGKCDPWTGLCFYQLKNGNGKCLATWGGSTEAGTRIVGYDCVGSDDQFWRPWYGPGSKRLIVNMKGYLDGTASVLGVAGGRTDNGAEIVLWWEDDTASQIWHAPF